MDKKQIVKRVISAFENQDFSDTKNLFSEDFVMDWPSFFSVDNLQDLELFLKKNAPKHITKSISHHFIEKENIIFHNGETTVELHSGLLVKNYFCDIYEFKNEKIKKITSYILHDK